jgi:hypothetical protein
MPNSKVYGEEIYKIDVGQGIYTAELASNIPDGFSASAFNFIATGDSLESRQGLRPSSIDYKKSHNVSQVSSFYGFFTQLSIDENTLPQWGWAWSDGTTNTISFIRSGAVGSAAGDGYMEINMGATGTPIGMCLYGDRVYFSIIGVGVYKINTINWSTDAITFSLIAGSAAPQGLFAFKDRLWGWYRDRLYYTDIAPVGGYPEVWNSSTNFVPFRGPFGYGSIMDVKIIGNRLLVFTESGLFSLIVEGAPQSWILRMLDGDSYSTVGRCAFESKNVVYYVNTQGVWATNGLYSTKLSGTIEDRFFTGTGRRFLTLHSLEDGMLLSIGNLVDGASFKFDTPNCGLFYSKLDPIAWTEWGVEDPTGIEVGMGSDKIALVHSVTKKLPCFLVDDPTTFILFSVSDSSKASPQGSRFQLGILDGGTDIVWGRTGASTKQSPVVMYLKTKFFDGGDPYSDKSNKLGMLEMFTSDSQHMIQTSWDADTTTLSSIRETNTVDYVVGTGSNLIKIKSDFMYRRCSLQLRTHLQGDNSTIKIKDIAIRQNTGAAVPEQVQ